MIFIKKCLEFSVVSILLYFCVYSGFSAYRINKINYDDTFIYQEIAYTQVNILLLFSVFLVLYYLVYNIEKRLLNDKQK